jgi:hypothetical protein
MFQESVWSFAIVVHSTVCVGTGVGVGVGEGVGVGVGVGLGVGEAVGAGLGVGVDVGFDVGMGLEVGEGDGEGVGVLVGLGVDVGLDEAEYARRATKTEAALPKIIMATKAMVKFLARADFEEVMRILLSNSQLFFYKILVAT